MPRITSSFQSPVWALSRRGNNSPEHSAEEMREMLWTDFDGLASSCEPRCVSLLQLPNGSVSLVLLHGTEQSPDANSMHDALCSCLHQQQRFPKAVLSESAPRGGKLLCVEWRQPTAERLYRLLNHHGTADPQKENSRLGILNEDCTSAKVFADWKLLIPLGGGRIQPSDTVTFKEVTSLVVRAPWNCSPFGYLLLD